MSTEKKSNTVLTPYFRVSFPTVFTAKPAVAGQEPKFSISMLFPKSTDLTELKTLIRAAAVEKWGPDQAKWPKNLRSPLRDGSEKDYEGYGPDVIFATASSKMRPGLVDQAVKPIIDPSEFYGGCWARATISVYAYDKAGNKGVAFGLRNIQKWKDDAPFSGASKPENDFDAIPVPAATSAAGGADPLAGDIGGSTGLGI